MNDEFGGVLVEAPRATDEFGGVAVNHVPGTDEFGGVPVEPSTSAKIVGTIPKAAYALNQGIAAGGEGVGRAVAELSDPGPLPNTYRQSLRVRQLAAENPQWGDNAIAVAFDVLHTNRDIQRTEARAPGEALEGGAKEVTAEWQALRDKQTGYETPAKAAEMVGGMLPFFAESAIPVVGPELAAAHGGLQSFGHEFDEAYKALREHGLSEEEARSKAGEIATAVGLGTGVLFSRLPGSSKTVSIPEGTKLTRTGLAALKSGGVMAADTEQRMLNEKATTKPELTTGEMTAEGLKSFATGAIIGGVAHAAHEVKTVPPEVKLAEENNLPATAEVLKEVSSNDGRKEKGKTQGDVLGTTAPAPAENISAVPGAPVPEKADSIAKQLEVTLDPESTKAVTLVTPGTPIPDKLPDGLFLIPAGKHGDAIFNPAKTTRAAVLAAAEGKDFDGTLLGMSQATKPEPVGNTVVQTTKDGVPVLDEVVSPTPAAIAAAATAHANAVPGGEMKIVPAEKVLAERTTETPSSPSNAPKTPTPSAAEAVAPAGTLPAETGNGAGRTDPVAGAVGVAEVPKEATSKQWRVNVNTAESKNVVKTVEASSAEEAVVKASAIEGVTHVHEDTVRQWDESSNIDKGALGEVGMGAAKTGEVEPQGTALKNATADLEREAHGLEPATPTERRAMGKAWSRAEETSKSDPTAGERLAQSLIDHPERGMTDDDSALLLRHKVDLFKAKNDAAERTQTGTPEERASAELDFARISDRLQNLLDAIKTRGSHWGREGRWRQALAFEDYSLETMRSESRATKGRELTPQEEARIKALHERIADLEKKLAAAEAKAKGKGEKEAVDDAVKEIDTEAKARSPKDATDWEAERAKAEEKIKAKVEQGKTNEITPFVKQLARYFWQKGIREREPMIDALHGVLKEIIPDFSREATQRAFSGYGISWEMSKDSVSQGIRDLSSQTQQVLKMAAIEAKKPLEKTGLIRDAVSDATRRLIAQVNELKRRFGVIVTDPAKQLASALQARKTYYEHRLSDLKHEIATRERIVKTKSPSPTDAALEALQAEYEKVKAEHDEIFPRAELTDEQKLSLALKAAERNEAEWNARLENAKKGIFDGTKKPGRTVNSAELSAIKARTDAVREQVQELKDLDTHVQAERAAKELKKVEARSAELERQINEGEIAAKEKPAPAISTPELEAARAERDQLIKAKQELQRAAAKKTPSEIEAKKLADMDAKIEALAKRINEGDVVAKTTTPKPASAEMEAKRAELADLNKVVQQLRNAAKPKKTAEEIALQALKTRLANRTAELKEKLAAGDFITKARKPVVLDPAAQKLRVEFEAAKKAYQKGLLEDQLSKRTRARKVADIALRIRREFVLSGFGSIFKLASYSAQEFGLAPIKEAVGAGLSKVPFLRDVAARAPSEVGRGPVASQVKAMAGDYYQAFTQGIRDAIDVATKGESGLKTVHDPSVRAETEFKSFFGKLHQMEKSPLLRFTFKRSLRRRMEFAAEHRVDITDTAVLQRLGAEAYQDALRSALIDRNTVVNKVNRFVNSLEEKSKVSGRTPVLGRVAKFAFGAETPVQHVPANYVARTAEYIFGSVTGSVKTAMAFRRGIDTLQPAEADQIMRHLKSGSIGSAAMLIGFLVPQMFGGFWFPTRDKEQELKPGEIKLGDSTVPKTATHQQLLNAAQFGATLRQASETKLRDKDDETLGLSGGAQAALFGLADEVPYVQEIESYTRARDPHTAAKFWGQKAKGYIVPQVVSQISEWMDKRDGEVIKRAPTTVIEHLKSGIPGLRSDVPEAQAR